MKKHMILSVLLSLCLTLAACAPSASNTGAAVSGLSETEGDGLHIVTTTYPLYLFANTVVNGPDGEAPMEDVTISRLNTQGLSCLHDYTLSVADMKLIESADVIIINGAGLEEFMEDALAQTSAVVVDCAQGIDLLVSGEHAAHHNEEETHEDNHDHGHYDPHYWMDPVRAAATINKIQNVLCGHDPTRYDIYQLNGTQAANRLLDLDEKIHAYLETNIAEWGDFPREMITFHDGFQYLADAYGFVIVKSIEEEEGSEASAMEIKEIVSLIQQYDIPVVFTETNGADATAQAVALETGIYVDRLSLIMDGESTSIDGYSDPLWNNFYMMYNYLARVQGW